MPRSKLRRVLDHNRTFNKADINSGDSTIFLKQISCKSARKWRGLGIIPDIDETGVNVKFRSRTLKFCRTLKIAHTRKRVVSTPGT